jgi:transposase
MPKKVWKDENYILAYELAKSGMSEIKMAQALGVSTVTLRKWKDTKPALRFAIEKASSNGGSENMSTVQDFHEYIYQKLPSHLAKIWDEIQAVEHEDNSILKIEAMLKGAGKRGRQHLFLHALVTSNFNVSRACSMMNMSRKTFENWVTNEPEFGELMQEIDFHKKNFFEAALIGLVAGGDSSATIFVNKTINRDRGYNDKIELDVRGSVQHEHLHAHIPMDELNLSLDVKREILKAIRFRNQSIDNESEEAIAN